MLKEKYGQPRMLNTMNISFKNESEIIFFSDPKKERKAGGRKKFTSLHFKKAKKFFRWKKMITMEMWIYIKK